MNPTPKTTKSGAKGSGILFGKNIATKSAVTPTTMSSLPRNANHRFRLSMRLPLLVERMLPSPTIRKPYLKKNITKAMCLWLTFTKSPSF
jgi:hypothetical protein